MSCNVKVIWTIGNTLIADRQIVFYDRIPEYPLPSRRVHPRPALTTP